MESTPPIEPQVNNQQVDPEPKPHGKWGWTYWAKASKGKRIAGVAVILLGSAYFYYIGTGQQPVEGVTDTNTSPSTSAITTSSAADMQPNAVTTNPASNTNGDTPAKTVQASGGFEVVRKSAFSCSADAPNDWTIDSNKEANSADLYSANKTMYAGYGIQAINERLAPYAGVYQAPLNNADLYSSDPGTVVKAYAGIIASGLGDGSSVAYTGDTNETIGNYTLRSFSTSGHEGLVFYYTNGFPGDGYNYSYIEPFYVAMVPAGAAPEQLLLVARVAASISCTTQVVEHDGPLVKAQVSSGSGDTATSSDANGTDAGYNVQLGTEYAHDSLGNNYLVDPSSNWSNTGPDGGGYYVSTSGGNSYEKLQAGRSD